MFHTLYQVIKCTIGIIIDLMMQVNSHRITDVIIFHLRLFPFYYKEVNSVYVRTESTFLNSNNNIYDA